MALGMTGAYDRAITVFSPQGRLYQVEYALETVRSGSTALSLVCNEGVVLAVEERMHTKLQSADFSWKIFQIDEHIGAATAGLNSDARVLVDNARVYSQTLRLSYDEEPLVEAVARRIGDIMQIYTQHAGVRPFGTALLIGGVDKTGPRLFYAEPSGLILEYNAWAIGRGAEKVRELFENNYSRSMTLQQSVELSLKALVDSVDKIEEGWTVRLVTIPITTRKYTMKSQSELNPILNDLLKAKKQ
ncbi:MAG: archaeal proteasome endopeptidase complex subunit alpha [Candidatus Caldarchaeum sp.]|nr:archaeal proteasome endopeptidase complex subunit alpha [Candidatus Caldarchaeum sp.]MCS7133286.1 archaeal proteasome endopeptidase complex subunit alpha [Candidatus Caldarchaeum sp.]MDW8062662.1 archaeal proteasome endopeptidase complex subunit alpha [Candidatus Caldarchaeum sp.]MDW8436125.1 archaeal proteasome endopeptidase complex subunit alpha [Candidatus Caldarchaeum sp.]